MSLPDNITLLHLPPYSPELNPVENIWQYLRQNQLSNRVFEGYDTIVDACCNAWMALMNSPEQIRSIATRQWARGASSCRRYERVADHSNIVGKAAAHANAIGVARPGVTRKA